MKRIALFLCVLVFSIISNTNNLLAKEIENNIKDNISNEIEEIKPNNKKTNTHKNKTILFIKNIYLILLLYVKRVI